MDFIEKPVSGRHAAIYELLNLLSQLLQPNLLQLEAELEELNNIFVLTFRQTLIN